MVNGLRVIFWNWSYDKVSGTKMRTRSVQEQWCSFQKDQPTGTIRVDLRSFRSFELILLMFGRFSFFYFLLSTFLRTNLVTKNFKK